MSVVENIFGISLVMLVVSIVALFAFFSVTDVFLGGSQVSSASFEIDRQNSNIDTVLNTKENSSGEPFSSLLSQALLTNSNNVSVNGVTVDVNKSFQKVLRLVYGENYYVELMPVISDVSFSFVLDGSGSFSDERALIASVIPRVYNDIKSVPSFKDINVSFEIYLLNVDDYESECDLFNKSKLGVDFHIDCRSLKSYALSPLMNQIWNIPQNLNYLSLMSKSAWISGSIIASRNFKNSIDETTWTTKLHLITILDDEPATSSFPNYCLSLNHDNDVAICALCNSSDVCNGREDPKISYKNIVSNYFSSYDRFIGLFAFNCNYNYSKNAPYWNVWKTPEVLGYSDLEQSPKEAGLTSWCDFNNCQACTRQTNDLGEDNYCFRPDCQQIVLDQMNSLVQEKGGEVIDINQINDLGKNLSESSIGIIQNEMLVFGKPFNHSFVVKKQIFLDDGKFTNLFVYS